MADKEVQYRLTLDDLMSGKLVSAEGAANAFEASMTRVIERVTEYAMVYGSIDFFKSAYEDFEKFNQAQIQLGGTLQQVGDRAGYNKDQLMDMAKAGRDTSEFTKDQYVEAESALLKFRGLSGDTYKETLQYAADIATKRHENVDSVAGMLGAVIGNPGEAGRRLRQFDVILTPYQQKWLRAQAALGHTAEAQQFIFQRLEDQGYKGAAALSAAADPMHDINAEMEDLKESLGEGLAELVKELAPDIIKVVKEFEELVGWIKQNGTAIKDMAEGVLTAWAAFKLLNMTWVPFMEGLEAAPVAEAAVTEGMEGMAVAADSAMGPLGLLALALGGIVELYKSWSDAKADAEKTDHDIYTAGEEKLLTENIALHKKLNPKASDEEAYQFAVGNEENDLTDREKGDNQRIADDKNKASQATKGKFGDALIDALDPITKDMQAAMDDLKTVGTLREGIDAFKNKHATSTPGKTNLKDPKAPDTEKGNAPKVVNINVHIDNMIREFTVRTTNISESAPQIKQKVAMAIVDALNDAEILAGQDK